MSDARRPLRLAPIHAMTYAAGIDLAAVICPPYDTIGPQALEKFQSADPHNIVHVTLPHRRSAVGPEPDADENGYLHAGRTLRRWLAAGVIRRDPKPALYVYEHRTPDRGSALGLVGGVGLDGPVYPHENTFPGTVRDRAALMSATGAQLEPILLTYDGDGTASDIVDAVADTPPDVELETVGAETHRVWRIADASTMAAIERDLSTRSALIADGHHRFAAYREVHAREPCLGGTDYGLALLVDAVRHPLKLRGIHRSVADLPFDRAMAQVGASFEVAPVGLDVDPAATVAREAGCAFIVGDDRDRVLLRSVDPDVLGDAMPPDRPAGWRRLDAAILTDVLLTHLWSVDDHDERVAFHHDSADAFDAARRRSGVAVIVRPPELSDVVALAAEGARMPRKSTSFGPKPWTGLLMRSTHD